MAKSTSRSKSKTTTKPSKKATPTTKKKKAPASKRTSSKASEKKSEQEVTANRRKSTDRREGDRRKKGEPVAVERRSSERREKVNRRRQIDPTTCERDYTPDEVEFMAALDEYKRKSGRMFPTCSEILEVLRGLGYEKAQKMEQLCQQHPAVGESREAAMQEQIVESIDAGERPSLEASSVAETEEFELQDYITEDER